MKAVEELSVQELFDRLSLAIYYGPALRAEIQCRPEVRKAAENLLAEIRADDFLCEKTEGLA